MRKDHIKPRRNEAAEAVRAAAKERKQKWKELPGNRYTPEELYRMSGEFGEFTIVRPKPRVMFID